jgi:hypothetical protein
MRGVGMPFRIILTAFLLVASLATLSSAPGFVTCAWSQGADPIAQGNDLYNQGKFKEAADLLKGAIDKGEVKPADLGAARELLARSMVKADRRGEARETFKVILRKDAAYRPDPNKVPPDEVAVFEEALRDFQAEQIEQGKRVPASICGFGGIGFFSAKEFNDDVKEYGGPGTDKKTSAGELGGSVRFPVRPKLSFEVEIGRLNTSTKDDNGLQYMQSAMSLIGNLYYGLISHPKWRVNGFVGGGPLLAPELRISDIPFFSAKLTFADQKLGAYIHGGAEGEYLLIPKLAVNARLLGRYAKGGKVSYGDITNFPFQGKRVDFSGFAMQLGLRAYIGY